MIVIIAAALSVPWFRTPSIVREGQFVTLDRGFVFHYRERGAEGALLGIFNRGPSFLVGNQ
ncbi:MAG TPA: hypothetical protein PK400_13905, partial [Phycisphaerales bacterium]|nr:hypothetical protein [Phycisphaerales bacterium]